MKQKIFGILICMLLITITALSVTGNTIVWDNGLNHNNSLFQSQEDQSPKNIDCIVADDFIFDKDTEVYDVHWIGGYFFGDPDEYPEYPWCIQFYDDDGTGNAPGVIYGPPSFYTHSSCNPVVIHTSSMSKIYSFNVFLVNPDHMNFVGGLKYWISIYALGDYPPEAGWGYHQDQFREHPAVFKSAFYGFPDWTDVSIRIGSSIDMCFQLTSNSGPNTPVIINGNFTVKNKPTDFTIFAIDPELDLLDYFIDWGDGTSSGWLGPYGSGESFNASHTWIEEGMFEIRCKAKDVYEHESSWGIFEITVSKSKVFNKPIFLLRLFQCFPIFEKILKQ